MIARGFSLMAISLMAALVCHSFAATPPTEAGTALFDGKTLDGWDGKEAFFRVKDGAIVAGRLEKKIPRNEFLCTTKEYGDFELRLKCKVDPPETNAGIQFRSRRVLNHNEVSGYQADVGRTVWGKLYDESRRNRYLSEIDEKALAKVLGENGWNEYVIRCEGPRVRLWINGHLTVDYTEKDADIPVKGIIGLQIHGGPPGEAWYKDIAIRELGD